MDKAKQAGTLLYAVDEKPPVMITIFQALQHVLTIYSSIVVVPIIIANAVHVPAQEIEYIVFASMIVTSISTLIQSVRVGKIGSGYTLFMGTSGAFLACSLSAAELGGFALVATMSMLAAPIEFLFSYFLGRLRKIITSAVGGVVIMLVPVTLVPIAISLWVGQPGSPAYGSIENLLIGLVTFIIILGASIYGNKTIRLWGPIIGIILGYILAAFLGRVDLSSVREAAFFGLPRGSWPGVQFELKREYLPLLLSFIIVTIVGSVETVGDAMAIQRVSLRNFKKIDYESVQGSLYSDGIGNFMAGLAGTVPNTTFSGNIAMVELTGVASRQVGMFGAAIIAFLAFFPKLSMLIINIPQPVLGASMLIFQAMLFVTGIQIATLSGVNYQSVLIIGLSFWSGFVAQNNLFFPNLIPPALAPLLNNGIATGGTVAFLLSFLFQLMPKHRLNLKLKSETGALEELNEFISEMEKSFKLTHKLVLNLQLLCEEVFIYLCNIQQKEGLSNHTLFTFIQQEDGIAVEVQDRSTADEIDRIEAAKDMTLATQEELDQLGLVLLSKMGQEVSHIRISGINYISFKLKME